MRLLITTIMLLALTVSGQDTTSLQPQVEPDVEPGLQRNNKQTDLPEFNAPNIGKPEVGLSQKDRERFRQKFQKRRKREKYEEELSEFQLRRVPEGRRAEAIREWGGAYGSYNIQQFDPVLPEPFRAIAEVRVPANMKQKRNQEKELAFFRSLGYDTVLVVWQGIRQSYELRRLILGLEDNWNILLTVNGASGRPQPYIDLKKIRGVLQDASQHIDGFLPLWRTMQPKQFKSETEAEKYFRALSKMVQRAGDIPVFGEVHMKRNPDVMQKALCPDGVAGAIMQGAEYIQVMEEVKLDEAKKLSELTNIIPVTVGPRPGYNYKNRDINKSEIWTLKKQAIKNYINKGAKGVILMVGDGTGNRAGNKPSLTQSKWRNQ